MKKTQICRNLSACIIGVVCFCTVTFRILVTVLYWRFELKCVQTTFKKIHFYPLKYFKLVALNAPPKEFEKSSWICKLSIVIPAIFCHISGQKFTNNSINFFIFGRDFVLILGIYPVLMAFLVQFLIFSSKNRFSS